MRSAVTIGDNALAQRLITGVEPHTRYAEHALIATAAAIAEATGDVPGAAEGYADAPAAGSSSAWYPSTHSPCWDAAAVSSASVVSSEATPALQQARGLFHALGAAPGIAETDALLETATALSS